MGPLCTSQMRCCLLTNLSPTQTPPLSLSLSLLSPTPFFHSQIPSRSSTPRVCSSSFILPRCVFYAFLHVFFLRSLFLSAVLLSSSVSALCGTCGRVSVTFSHWLLVTGPISLVRHSQRAMNGSPLAHSRLRKTLNIMSTTYGIPCWHLCATLKSAL